eukprot:CAMPEP_0206615814 /NCGR_PEP_ID=MMETSP0325_2-20121206/58534_1 /ASSEMBLY_ACC=CAM_ASM_000347 /TAXON_ID=2866 /ORGANISM="Crypthecodinium cohnii, Strain Seligo" /LENGTH=350 /DNA_ID=CAMNT_0054137219 /DNA_START=47 /DNA_END=1096 /DNA_ORIENTATION=+
MQALLKSTLTRRGLQRLAAPLGVRGAAGAPMGRPGVPPSAEKKGPTLVGVSGAPIASTKGKNSQHAAGPEIQLTQSNVQQVLQNPGAILIQVGTLNEGAAKKLERLRMAAEGRLPLVHLDCTQLPQICEALQIQSDPTVLLLARGQVAAALEHNITPQAATSFVEHIVKLLNLKVDLAESVNEMLQNLEELEWTDPAAAEAEYQTVGSGADLPLEARVKAEAGRIRAVMRQPGRLEEARLSLDNLTSGGHHKLAEVKQAAAMLWLADKSQDAPKSFQQLEADVAADPKAYQPTLDLATSLYWSHREGEALKAALALLRKNRSEESKQLVLSILEALGPRHPEAARGRKSF